MGKPLDEKFSFGGNDTSQFAKWFEQNVTSSVVTYDSGIKMCTWMGLPPGTDVEFGTDNRFHFVYTYQDIRSVVTLFDGTNVGMFQRSIIKTGDRISIIYIPEYLLSLDYFETPNGSEQPIDSPNPKAAL